MKPEDEKRVAANLARIMAMLCVRNTQLETLHAGLTPVTRTGDYSDLFVTSNPVKTPRLETHPTTISDPSLAWQQHKEGDVLYS